MAPPRILLAAESLRRGSSGIARVARLVARVLADEAREGRIQAHALALNDGSAVTDLGIPVFAARGSRPAFVAAVHAAAPLQTALIYDFAGMARAQPRVWPLARRHMVWIHGVEIWDDAREDRLARARAADVLLANSAYTRARANALHSGLAHAQVCWLATEEAEPGELPTFEGEPRVMMLSRLDEGGGYKGHRELIEAWPAVIASIPEARLIIGGAGPGRAAIEAWVRRSAARDRIELLGYVPEGQLARLYRESWLFAMPSRGEGFGVAYIEAMRHGLPVLASIHDAAPEINLHGETGVNVDLDAPSSLAGEIIRLLRDPGELQRLGRGGLARWNAHFQYRSFAERFLPQLRALVPR